MPIKSRDLSDSAETEYAPHMSAAKAPGTVLKAFNGPTRRFAVDYVVLDADAPDLPMSMDDLRAGGFVA